MIGIIRPPRPVAIVPRQTDPTGPQLPAQPLLHNDPRGFVEWVNDGLRRNEDQMAQDLNTDDPNMALAATILRSYCQDV